MSRLEEIIERYVDDLLNDGYFKDTITITSKDYLWLIKQVERVEELESTTADEILVRKGYKYALDKAMGQRNRYKQALEFYANIDNHSKLIIDGNTMYLGRTIVEQDGGDKARQALDNTNA